MRHANAGLALRLSALKRSQQVGLVLLNDLYLSVANVSVSYLTWKRLTHRCFALPIQSPNYMTSHIQEQFDDIRPYYDHEVRPTLDKLLKDDRFLNILAHHSYPLLTEHCGALANWLTGVIARRKLKHVNTIRTFQSIVESLLSKAISKTTSKVTFSGLEQLKKGQAYLFLSNHRDIVLDPALVHYGLYQQGIETPRIAIGDNLLKKPFVSDLMRLNKSFIVKRSVAGRKEKLQAYKDLSAYIQHSITTGHSIWIAQSEGRAKDGNDKTDTAIIKMLYMSQRGQSQSFAESIHNLHIIPVAISYEYDPCDKIKAEELYQTEQQGHYKKAEDEDMLSIATGIEGFKGHVHIAFGSELTGSYETAADVAEAVDQQIYKNYQLHSSNYLAWEQLKQQHPLPVPEIKTLFSDNDLATKQQIFQERLHNIPQNLHAHVLNMYARPLINHFAQNNSEQGGEPPAKNN